MSLDQMKYVLKPSARKLIAAAFAVFINVVLFSLVGALFATDSIVSGGGTLL
jgi:hypothetical protein